MLGHMLTQTVSQISGHGGGALAAGTPGGPCGPGGPRRPPAPGSPWLPGSPMAPGGTLSPLNPSIPGKVKSITTLSIICQMFVDGDNDCDNDDVTDNYNNNDNDGDDGNDDDHDQDDNDHDVDSEDNNNVIAKYHQEAIAPFPELIILYN